MFDFGFNSIQYDTFKIASKIHQYPTMQNSDLRLPTSDIKKIAIVGPESTGKSTMSAYLANHYNTVWVPEFAREYCEKLTAQPTWQDEINMFHGQLALEKELLPKANRLLICDTTFITVKIWSDQTFGRSPQEVLDELPKHPYDLYLLLSIDLPWQEDPLRDFPHMREHFMAVWHKELQALNAWYHVITGTGSDRYASAVKAIDYFLVSPHP
ncbi:MAG: hypothetical protein NVSMB24_20580 [Mucilaginibacter sp.]